MSDNEEVKEEETPPQENGDNEENGEEPKSVTSEPCVEERVKKTSATEETNDRLTSQNAVVQPLLTGNNKLTSLRFAG